jgi:hypothetical protein
MSKVIGICLIAAVLAAASGFAQAPAGAPAAPDPAKPADDNSRSCSEGSSPDIVIERALIDPKNLADAFGYRIAHRFIGIQLTIVNKNADMQYLVHDVTIDYRRLVESFLEGSQPTAATKAEAQRKLIDLCDGEMPPGLTDAQRTALRQANPERSFTNACRGSSADLTLLRGVAEKGTVYDPRNLALRILEGIGVVAGGLTGIPIRGRSYATSVAIFSGPIVEGYNRIWPDFTIQQLNRLNDLAYVTNTLIPRQQSRIVVAFLPQPMFLSREQQKTLYKNPHEILIKIPKFRLVNACVRGAFIEEVNNLKPVVSDIDIPDEQGFAADEPDVKGALLGGFFPGGQLRILEPKEGVSIEADDEPGNSRFAFTIKAKAPIVPDTTLKIQVLKAKDATVHTHVVKYNLPKPTASIDIKRLERQDTAAVITGEHFVKGHAVVKVEPSDSKLLPTDITFELTSTSSQKLEGKFKLPSSGAPKASSYKWWVETLGKKSDEKVLDLAPAGAPPDAAKPDPAKPDPAKPDPAKPAAAANAGGDNEPLVLRVRDANARRGQFSGFLVLGDQLHKITAVRPPEGNPVLIRGFNASTDGNFLDIGVAVPAKTNPGTYMIQLISGGKVVKEIPFKVD